MRQKKIEPYREELKKAIRIFGSQRQLSEEINAYITTHRLNTKKIAQQNLSNWLHRDKKIPRDFPPIIEAITQGVISAATLRGDGAIKNL